MKQTQKKLALIFYYAFARHLPDSFHLQPLGKVSRQLRCMACKYIFKSMGENVNIDRGAKFGAGSQIEIGDDAKIGVNCQMPDDIKIGNDVMIGPDVLILGHNHDFSNLELPMRLQGIKKAPPVSIENDVWIGARVIILPGIKIEKGTIIGAGAVVAKNIPPYSICVGNPARIIKSREEIKKEKV